MDATTEQCVCACVCGQVWAASSPVQFSPVQSNPIQSKTSSAQRLGSGPTRAFALPPLRAGPPTNASSTAAAAAPPEGCCRHFAVAGRRPVLDDGPRRAARPPPHRLRPVVPRARRRRAGPPLCVGQVAGRLQGQVEEDDPQEDGREEDWRYVSLTCSCLAARRPPRREWSSAATISLSLSLSLRPPVPGREPAC